jgi:hypothetical protein
VRNFVNPYQDIDNSKPQDESLEKRIGNQWTELGIEIQQIIVLPGPHPWETEQPHPESKRKQYVKKVE